MLEHCSCERSSAYQAVAHVCDANALSRLQAVSRSGAVMDLLTAPGPEFLATNRWTALALLVVLVAALLGRIVTVNLAPRALARIVRLKRTSTALLASERAIGTAAGAGIALVLLLQMKALHAEGSDLIVLPGVVFSILIGAAQLVTVSSVVMAAYRLVGIVEDVVEAIDSDDELDGSQRTVVSALESVLRFLILFIGGVFVADAFGLDLTSLLAGLGISGLALALAAKDTISNFFGAITVLLDRPFKVGDWIIVDGSEGEVVEINLRTTILRTSSDTILTVPNANLVSAPVENWGKRRWRRWQTALHLDLGSDPQAVETFCDKVVEAIRTNPKTLREEASWCTVDGISAQSIDVGVNLYWDITSSVEERKAREDLVLSIVRIAKDLGLEFHDARVRQSR